MKDWQRIEAVLFGSGKYLTEDQIVLLSGVQKKNLKKALTDIKSHYSEIESSLDIFNESDAWKLNVKEEYSSIVKNVISEAEMPKPIMETLAIISYKSPILQAEVIDIRGAGAYEHIALLEEKGFITKEKLGRTFKIKITQKFYDYFDISGDSKLRQMFKGIKKPDAMGTLEIYTQNKPVESEDGNFSEKILERMKKIEEHPEEHAEKKRFLEDFDKKFDRAKNQVDETDNEMNEFRKIIPEDNDVNSNSISNNSSSNDDSEKILKKFNDEVDKLSSNDEIEDDENDESIRSVEDIESNDDSELSREEKDSSNVINNESESLNKSNEDKKSKKSKNNKKQIF
ncbi:MAG: SMC-Scp complex subunit ScpB [Candidatus Woesearchaeota archaeon]|jgi:segregation and condensation protein B